MNWQRERDSKLIRKYNKKKILFVDDNSTDGTINQLRKIHYSDRMYHF